MIAREATLQVARGHLARVHGGRGLTHNAALDGLHGLLLAEGVALAQRRHIFDVTLAGGGRGGGRHP